MIIDSHQAAVEMLKNGDRDAALARFDACLKDRPDNGYVWNDAGVVLFSQGRMEEAIRYFCRAVKLDTCPPRAFGNLARAYAAAGQPGRAMRLFERLRYHGQLDGSLIVRIADAFCAQDDAASAMEALCRGRQALPDAAELDDRIRTLAEKRAKIAFFVGGDGPTFLNKILPFIRQRYPVRLFDGKTTGDMLELMRWCDIAWFEWCTDLVAAASKLPKVCRTIVRLHRYEAFERYPALIDWGKIDTLVTVGNSNVIRALNAQVGDIGAKTSVVRIPNGVDVDAMAFTPRQPGKNLAFVANMRMVKNPMLLLNCMAALKEIDSGYRLFIAGRMDDRLIQQYFEHAVRVYGLEDNVIFEGFQTDIPGWLADKHYIISTSVIESQGMGILEAMASGIKPVIHYFPGADEIFGLPFLFTTAEDFCRRIQEPTYDSQVYRTFVEQRYPISRQLLQINELLAAFENAPCKGTSAGDRHGQTRLAAMAV